MTQLTDRIAELHRRAERTTPGVSSHSVLVFGAEAWMQAWSENLIVPGGRPDQYTTVFGLRCCTQGPREFAVDKLKLVFEVHE